MSRSRTESPSIRLPMTRPPRTINRFVSLRDVDAESASCVWQRKEALMAADDSFVEIKSARLVCDTCGASLSYSCRFKPVRIRSFG
jgi:hypothetical protein